jgi:hypothetical protein
MSATRQQQLIAATLEARAETTTVDPGNKGEWIELLRDIAAFANSGGGVLLFGIDNAGNPTGLNCQPILDFDIARISDKLRKYTGSNFGDLVLFGCDREGLAITGLYVGSVEEPLVFVADGQYTNAIREERLAFRAGIVYFRHGAKSEAGTSDDLRQFFDRRIDAVRGSWLLGIRQVVEAPPGTQVRIVGPKSEPTAEITKVCIVTDGSGDPRRPVNADDTPQSRQIDIIRLVNERLAPHFAINQANVQDIRKAHRIEEKPQFYHKGKVPGAPTPFSDAFVEGIVESYRKDPDFFRKARSARQALNRARVDVRSRSVHAVPQSIPAEEFTS